MRKLEEIFRNNLQNLWNSLELRVLVILSLILQIFLISTGNRRKYTRKRRVKIGVWLAYLSADSVATIALGVLSKSEGVGSLLDPNYTIMAFWAPFLLMHLGGPDTITAYALADNELWARHFLGLISQAGAAVYVLLRSWTGATVNYLWLVIFGAGMIKYGERTYVLFLASRDQYRKSMVALPDPGPNYAKFMDEYISKEAEGYVVSLVKAIEDVSASESIDPATNVSVTAESGVIVDASVLQDAYNLFGTFKKLFSDLILSFQDRETSLSFFKTQSWGRAFGIVEIELGLMYDLFYTKAFLLYSPLGCFLRLLSCSITVSVFVAFLIIDKHMYRNTEVFITCILLVGAIFLEIYAIIILLSSDRTMIWLSEDWTKPVLRLFKDPIVSIICKIVSLLQYCHMIPVKRRWSNAMGQYNVLNYCLKSKPKCSKVRLWLDKYLFKKSVYIPNGLKALLFDNLKVRVENNQLGTYRGDKILLKEIDCFQKSGEVEFDQSLILWHIATDLCYLTDDGGDSSDRKWLYEFEINEQSHSVEILKFKREMSRWLSDYMIYLLIKNPFMLPSGIGQIRFQDTCAEAKEFFESKKYSREYACEKLLQVKTLIPPSEVKGDRSKSLLFDACKLAESLLSQEVGEKWEKIFQVWLDILTFAAAQCRWNDHAEKLSEGGELLTHVWLLMAHFGMTDHFQISQGYMRAKLQAI